MQEESKSALQNTPMVTSTEPIEPSLQPGYDELNLAEFAVARLSDRADKDVKSIRFTDKVWDASQNRTITRTLKITPSAEYGFPTALDDEILLGLVQLTKQHCGGELPNEPVDIQFSRYQLLKVLGWKLRSENYARVEESIRRWAGVTLYYDNAWWNKENRAWANETFHYIDNATFFESDGESESAGQKPLFQSSFRWNRVMWRSFKSGNLKGLDFQKHQRLDSAIAKRLYRFLDKRFYHKSSWKFDLAELCYEHIGLSRNYDASNLKRKLIPAILELEREKFLLPKPAEERFLRIRAGDWDVFFDAYGKGPVEIENRVNVTPVIDGPSVPNSEGIRGLRDTLVGYGVSPTTADALVNDYPAERIIMQIEVLEWKRASNDKSILQNPPGYLISAIRGDYKKPTGFVSVKSLEERQKARAEREERAKRKALEKQLEEERREKEKKAIVDRFWESYTGAMREQAEGEALSRANEIERGILERGTAGSQALRKALLEKYALEMLSFG